MPQTLNTLSDLIGKPHVQGASGPDAYDCFGLLREIMRRDGITIPDHARTTEEERHRAWLTEVRAWERVERQPGTMIAYRRSGDAAPRHFGYLVEEGVLTSMPDKGVFVDPFVIGTAYTRTRARAASDETLNLVTNILLNHNRFMLGMGLN